MPRWIYSAIILVNLFFLIPPVMIARARVAKSREPRIHLFHDMDNQRRYAEQSHNPNFADGRAMRPPVPGTIARGELWADDHYYRGRVGDDWASGFPPNLAFTPEFVERGRQRYGIYCTPCHGNAGHGDGIVAKRTQYAEYGAWVVGDLNAEKARNYPVGHVFNIITNGINTMPSYRGAIPVEDRWAIIAWVRALQYSQAVEIASLPADVRADLQADKPGPEKEEPVPEDEKPVPEDEQAEGPTDGGSDGGTDGGTDGKGSGESGDNSEGGR